MSCPHCQHTVDPSARRCPHCGRSLVHQPGGTSDASPAPAATGLAAQVLNASFFMERANGRFWPARALVLLFCAWVMWWMTVDSHYHSIFDGINLGIHEGGHLLFRPLGTFLTIAGGTISQLLAPLICGAILFRQRDDIGLAFCLIWLATNCHDISVYMADARAMQLNLVTVGGGGAPIPKDQMHDWHNLLGRLGLLSWDTTLAFLVRWSGLLLGWTAVLWSAWWCWQAIHHNKAGIVCATPQQPPETP